MFLVQSGKHVKQPQVKPVGSSNGQRVRIGARLKAGSLNINDESRALSLKRALICNSESSVYGKFDPY
jgi:hypothetical protein